MDEHPRDSPVCPVHLHRPHTHDLHSRNLASICIRITCVGGTDYHTVSFISELTFPSFTMVTSHYGGFSPPPPSATPTPSPTRARSCCNFTVAGVGPPAFASNALAIAPRLSSAQAPLSSQAAAKVWARSRMVCR